MNSRVDLRYALVFVILFLFVEIYRKIKFSGFIYSFGITQVDAYRADYVSVKAYQVAVQFYSLWRIEIFNIYLFENVCWKYWRWFQLIGWFELK